MPVAQMLAGATAENRVGLTDAQIHDRIIAAILDHRLLPGTKLGEDKLGQAFGVSRTRVRQVLIRLANERIVTITPHRGATVTQPDRHEASEVFEVRRLIEPPLLEGFIAQATAARLDTLGALVEQEARERAQGNRHAAVRLSGEFHLQIAQESGQQTLARILAELVTRTSLILMRYPMRDAARGADHLASCCDAHRTLLAAMCSGDSKAAGRLVKSHLTTLERQIDFAAEPSQPPDLIVLFSSR